MVTPPLLLDSLFQCLTTLSVKNFFLFSRPFTSFIALLWTRFSTSMSLLQWGPETEHSILRCGLTSAKYRGMITALVLLATLFWYKPGCYWPSWPPGHTAGSCSAGWINQHPQVLFCQAAFQPPFPKPVALCGVVVTQVQDPALSLVEPHTTGLSPLVQPVQIPLQSLPALKQINTPPQLGVICKLTEGALNPLIQIIDKDIKQNWPQYWALGNTTCDWSPAGCNSIHHHSLGLGSAIQPAFLPSMEYTHPSHEQPVSPGECCGRWCQRLY